MAICLELVNGEYAGRFRRLEPGEVLRAGSSFAADLPVPDDAALAPEHFAAVVSDKGVEVFGLGGQTVTSGDGSAGTHGIYQAGHWLIAGRSLFRLTNSEEPVPSPVQTPVDRAIHKLRFLPNLFAVLDVSRDPEWRVRLESGCDVAQQQPLAEGFATAETLQADPWLVELNAPLTGWIVRRAWGLGQVSFVQSAGSFRSMILHFQRKIEAGGANARVWDPRWLRLALRSLPEAEWKDWMGPLEQIFLESRLPRLMEHWQHAGGPAYVDLAVPVEGGAHAGS